VVGSIGCVGIEEVIPTRDAEYLKRRLAELRRKLGCPGHVDDLQVDKTSDDVSFDKLEAYKKAVESTTVLQDKDHFGASGRDNAFENHDSFALGEEHEDVDPTELAITEHDMILPISAETEEECHADVCNDAVDASAILGYTLKYRDAVTGAIFDASAILGYTLEYRDALTGAMLGYLFCDDGDDELHAVRTMREGEVEFTEEVEECDRESDHGATIEAHSDRQSSSTEQSSSQSDYEESDVEEPHGYMEAQYSYEWEDKVSGTVLAYATCDEETEEEVIQLGVISQEAVDSSRMMNHDDVVLQIGVEWRDQPTGVMMGYAFCDDCSEADAYMDESTRTASGKDTAVAAVQKSADANPKRRLRSRPFAATLSKVMLIAQSAKRRRLQSARRRQRESMRLATNYWDVLSNRHEAAGPE
jgi:hypothetical protein